ncbi:MAG TPA: polysaccharide biosynthesis protein, partial [Armatimonadota bacterium]|nr:polysaccharide biosynthesis protein [Armatimonadota bacterium]
MKKLPVLRVRYILLFDLCGILLSYAAAFVMRFEPAVSVWPYLTRFEGLLWLSLLVRIPVYAAFGLYNHLWRYAGTRELRGILAAGTLSSILIAAADRLILPFLGYASCDSRSILILDWLLNLACLSATRMCIRMGQEWASARERRANANSTAEPHSVLVVGAGETGARVLREMSSSRDLGMTPVGLVDDDPKKWGMRVHGVPVLGSCEDLPQLLKQRSVDEVIVTMPSAPGRVLREVKRICKEAGLPIRVMPGMEELLDGTVSVKQLREVQLEDLLRRDPVVTNQAGVRSYIEGTRVLVTGAGGSIGSELCRQIARQTPELLLLLGHGENSIFLIERELRKRFPKTPVRPVIADVRDVERIDQIIQRYRPEVIFHAAAHKHVPLMECNPAEAIT